MQEQPPADRFKAEMPQIPGVSGPGSGRRANNNPTVRLVIGLIVVLVVCGVGARLLLRPTHIEATPLNAPPQIEVPPPAPSPDEALPHSTSAHPSVAEIAEMSKPWASKEFFFRNRLTGENIPALLIRLPLGSAAQSASYWAFSVKTPYGDCEFEYITDLDKLQNDYGFRGAKHPMIGNPCSRTVFDPLKLTNLPGNVWVRGAIVQGSDLRPPLGIEVKIQGKEILAVRSE